MFSMLNSYMPTLSPDLFIDTLQGAKRNLTDKTITDPVLNKAAHDFMNAQVVWAKMMSSNTLTITNYFVESQTRFWFPKENKGISK